MTNSTILLVGNCVLDKVWELEYFPQQDKEMRALGSTQVLGGNACNSAQILAQLGDDVELMSSLAEDSTARWILQELKKLGISTTFCVQHAGCSTAQSSIWLNSQNGSRTIVHHRDLPELTVNELKRVPLEHYEWIHFEGRNIASLLEYLPQLKKLVCPVSLEIEKNREGIEQLLPFINTVIVSSAYLESKQITAEQCLKSLRKYNSELNIACTLGASGLLAQDHSGKLIHLAAEQVDRVVDTVGAGDCFIAGLIHRLHKQHDFESALIYANKLAAQKIQLKGMKFDDD
ncbi:MAG: carbohydrate kinase [Gammaproteobacteria bacterium]|nr:carbohydrate kinase [Gammaproteobacteria bacterium]